MEKSSLDAAMFVKNNKINEKSGTLAPSVLYYTQPKPTFHIPIAASLESPSRSPIGSLTVSANR